VSSSACGYSSWSRRVTVFLAGFSSSWPETASGEVRRGLRSVVCCGTCPPGVRASGPSTVRASRWSCVRASRCGCVRASRWSCVHACRWGAGGHVVAEPGPDNANDLVSVGFTHKPVRSVAGSRHLSLILGLQSTPFLRLPALRRLPPLRLDGYRPSRLPLPRPGRRLACDAFGWYWLRHSAGGLPALGPAILAFGRVIESSDWGGAALRKSLHDEAFGVAALRHVSCIRGCVALRSRSSARLRQLPFRCICFARSCRCQRAISDMRLLA
jgi:hypothetical protein